MAGQRVAHPGSSPELTPTSPRASTGRDEPDRVRDTEAAMTSETFAHVIGCMEADPLWRLALEADPWQALACYLQIGRAEPRLATSLTDRGTRRRTTRVRHDRAA